jgi:RNase P/RNase MRP subunit p29
MGLSVKVDLPQFPEDTVVGIAGLGSVKNGETLEITEEMEQEFLSVQGRTVKTAFEGQEGVEVSGSATVEEPEKPEEEEGSEPEPQEPAPEPQPTNE